MDYKYFPKELLEKAKLKSWTLKENWSKDKTYCLGIDPARFGKCKAALAVSEIWKENVNIVHGEAIKKSSMVDLMKLTERLDKMFNSFKMIFIDGIGVGAGLVDFLREKFKGKVKEMNNNSKGEI